MRLIDSRKCERYFNFLILFQFLCKIYSNEKSNKVIVVPKMSTLSLHVIFIKYLAVEINFFLFIFCNFEKKGLIAIVEMIMTVATMEPIDIGTMEEIHVI